MSDSLRPYGLQPTRLLHPWDFPVLEWGAIAFSKSVLKEINPECSLEGLIPKLKLQYFGCLMRRDDSLEKTLMIERLQQEKGATANEMVG